MTHNTQAATHTHGQTAGACKCCFFWRACMTGDVRREGRREGGSFTGLTSTPTAPELHRQAQSLAGFMEETLCGSENPTENVKETVYQFQNEFGLVCNWKYVTWEYQAIL